MRACPSKLRGYSWQMLRTSQLFMLHGALLLVTCAVGDRSYPVEILRAPEYADPHLVDLEDIRRLDSTEALDCPIEDNQTIFEVTNSYVNARHYQCLTNAGCDTKEGVCDCYAETINAYAEDCEGEMLKKYMNVRKDWQKQVCVDETMPVCLNHEIEEDNFTTTYFIIGGVGAFAVLAVLGFICFLQMRYHPEDSDSDSDEDDEKKKKKHRKGKGKGKGKGYAHFDDSGEKGKGKWYEGKGGSDGNGESDGKGGWSVAPPPQHYGKGEDQGMQGGYSADGKGGDKGDGKGSKGPLGDAGAPVDDSSGSDVRKGFEGGKGKGRGKGRGKVPPDPGSGASPWPAAVADPDAGWGTVPVQVDSTGWSGARE